jgi:hypothetical protein
MMSFTFPKMYKVEIQQEKIAQEAILRRKKLNAERKERIFNPKVRILGVNAKLIRSTSKLSTNKSISKIK